MIDKKIIIYKTIVISIACILGSVAITKLIYKLMHTDRVSTGGGLLISIVVPAIIAPLLTFYLLKSVAELKTTKDYLLEANRRDFLTGIYNRQYIMELLGNEFQSSRRYNFPVSLIYIDLDYFKPINDTYGHEAGDYVLKRFSQLILSNVRATDIFGRFGGDEFLLICSHTSLEGVKDLAEKLRNVIQSEEFRYQNKSFKLTSSFGVVTNSAVIKDIHTLLKSADQALYEAKKSGRNCVMICG
jgi:diguanylate cyclase (GGDEF)-like protein